MKNRILDISDCSESPLLASSRNRVRHYKFPRTGRGLGLQSGTNPGLGGLTEFYFKGVSAGSQLDYQLNTPSIESRQAGSRSLEPVSAAPANISYQARCAERWWDEFRRWFGTQE